MSHSLQVKVAWGVRRIGSWLWGRDPSRATVTGRIGYRLCGLSHWIDPDMRADA